MGLLQVSGIGLQENEQVVLQHISFGQAEFQKIAIAGETGSGKSSLLQIIAGLIQPTSGQVLFDQVRIKGPHEQLIPGHPEIAYLSQQFELPQFLRVEQVLNYANKLATEEADILFELCRISHLLSRKTNQLSGGERQRIALARLLLGSPRLLLLDEPYSNLDVVHKNLLKTVIKEIGEKLEITLILISHDPLDTLSWANEILVIQHGKLVQQGTTQQIYHQPKNEYVASLFGTYNLLSPAQSIAFKSVPGLQSGHKNLLIRPEKLRLSTNPISGFPGFIQNHTFFGSFYELQVQVSGISLQVRTSENHYNTGDQVYLSFSPKDVWYL